MNKDEKDKLALPTANDQIINEDLYETEEDKLSLGLNIIASTNTLEEFSPNIKYSNESLTRVVDDMPKNLGLVDIANRNASKALKVLGVVTSRKLTLFHSGYNVGVSSLSPSVKMALQVSLATVQSEIGMTTLGIGFNNESALIVRHVIDTLESLVEVSTYRTDSPLRDALITDMQHIMMLALEDNVDIVQACANKEDGERCNHIHQYTAYWKNLIHADTLNEDRNHSILWASKVTPKDINEYQSYITNKSLNVKIMDKEVSVKLSIPTIGYYIEYGELWLREVNKAVDLMMIEKTEVSRKAILTSTFNVNSLQLYGHFIGSITIDGEEMTSIRDILDIINLIKVEEIDLLIEDIKEFVKENTFSVVGVPAYNCLSCNKEMKEELDSPFKEIVSINMVKTFLELTNLNLMRLVNK